MQVEVVWLVLFVCLFGCFCFPFCGVVFLCDCKGSGYLDTGWQFNSTLMLFVVCRQEPAESPRPQQDLQIASFSVSLREGVAMPWGVKFRKLNIWKSVLQEENGQKKIPHFHISALHPHSSKGLQEMIPSALEAGWIF